ncbi:CUB and sushi domain-containing protein 3-like [Tubulanus polymorphus]|uniref:CUB and sushi domain-containing protein 3-like n=1 Tax=Tubulanus polymorphus TaxID=672921 RepID=UPI003DA3E8A9
MENILRLLLAFWATVVLIKGESGLITSPNFPEPYAAGPIIEREIVIDGDENRLQLTVTKMKLAPEDKVFIYEGTKSDALREDSLREVYEGSAKDVPLVLFMARNKAFIRFERRKGGGLGWRIEYQGFPRCNGEYTSPTGNIINPNFPYKDYANHRHCNWKITLGKGQIIEFRIREFVLDACSKSYARFTNIQGKANNELLICDTPKIGVTFRSINEHASITFQSERNFFTSQRGFWIEYRALGCKEEEIPLKSRIILLNKSAYYEFGYVARFRCEKNYQFPYDIKETTAVCMYNIEKGPHWEGNVPQCEEMKCPALTKIPRGNLRYSGVRINSTVIYSCERGYKLEGYKTRICFSNGTWSGHTPKCIRSGPCSSNPCTGHARCEVIKVTDSKLAFECTCPEHEIYLKTIGCYRFGNKTENGNSEGAPCVLPFVYNGQLRHGCIFEAARRPWCSVTPNFDEDYKWGYCSGHMKVTGGNDPGATCAFPFIFEGKSYSHCLPSADERTWCATVTNYDSVPHWGYCHESVLKS